jgi:2-polyprenyl-3-methyl-5-hydroxy-6-metoxy-1,4-benzoquinol methylase
MKSVDEFDLITAFDAIHDQARPKEVLKNIATALRPVGLFLMQDISGSGGPGVGAMWGKSLALQMLSEAGLGKVKVETLAHDPMNYWYFAEHSRATDNPAGASFADVTTLRIV